MSKDKTLFEKLTQQKIFIQETEYSNKKIQKRKVRIYN